MMRFICASAPGGGSMWLRCSMVRRLRILPATKARASMQRPMPDAKMP
jgi:hypothetical protein